jgi:2-methylaconitate cis-trans-isomerase PrpF
MRGGTSRGPYMRRSDLPDDEDTLSAVLIAMMGAGHSLNIDGLGGGNPVATKTAMLSRSDDDWADIDYFFAQVAVDRKLVDYAPTCGNILSGVGPASVELGLIEPGDGTATIRIRMVNTGARAEAVFDILEGSPVYSGPQTIHGVPGSAAPVDLRFMDTIGSRTGRMLPTGQVCDTIDGVDVTCLDVAMPMVIARAEDLRITGHESSQDLDANAALFARLEPIRREAGRRMGLGDVSEKVVPKFGVIAAPHGEGAAAARYFMPWKTHPTMAVTGAQCLAACLMLPGSVATGLARLPEGAGRGDAPFVISLEHPTGTIDVTMDCKVTNVGLDLRSAGIMRTARMLARGEAMVPRQIWPD